MVGNTTVSSSGISRNLVMGRDGKSVEADVNASAGAILLHGRPNRLLC